MLFCSKENRGGKRVAVLWFRATPVTAYHNHRPPPTSQNLNPNRHQQPKSAATTIDKSEGCNDLLGDGDEKEGKWEKRERRKLERNTERKKKEKKVKRNKEWEG
ncbi:hypothetical protein Tsubulata_016687 [Turnera subulata]|uniref:Uncharacterized protein n=1 Tax=Turnera subulata TaxID=218843 RepID=A0A9Q0GC04_9ROSI|nr:hypothetical protein Tsubulata_016687 [Turnera subulata]